MREVKHLRDGVNPRSRMVKDLEMAVRRAGILDRLMGLYTSAVGYGTASRVPPLRSTPEVDKLAREAVGQPNYWRHPLWSSHVWPWVYKHWSTGALQASVDATLKNLPKENRTRALEKLNV